MINKLWWLVFATCTPPPPHPSIPQANLGYWKELDESWNFWFASCSFVMNRQWKPWGTRKGSFTDVMVSSIGDPWMYIQNEEFRKPTWFVVEMRNHITIFFKERRICRISRNKKRLTTISTSWEFAQSNNAVRISIYYCFYLQVQFGYSSVFWPWSWYNKVHISCFISVI